MLNSGKACINLSVPLLDLHIQKVESRSKPNPREVMDTSFLEASEPDLDEDAQHLVQEGYNQEKPLNLKETKPPSQPPIKLKPLPSGLDMFFLNGD